MASLQIRRADSAGAGFPRHHQNKRVGQSDRTFANSNVVVFGKSQPALYVAPRRNGLLEPALAHTLPALWQAAAAW